ncbi:MAG TPA: hypothetical protein VE959_36160 [Bryobacteraceae bacterium]|nr:hypothetical protein [Bryobacteraceae bacterium]
MLSARLVGLIEGNWEEIAARLIRAIRGHPDMRHLAARPEAEIREWCREILINLGRLLSAGREEEVQRRFQVMGRARFEERIPLDEAVLRLHLLKYKIAGFVHEQGYTMTAMQLYAEEELDQRVGRFFDACVYNLVRGYENAKRVAARVAS